MPSLKFAGRRRGNIIRFLYYHLISCDHMIKETCNFASGGPVTTAKFNVYRSHGSEDKTFPRCLVTLFGNVIKCHLWEEDSKPKLPKCQVVFKVLLKWRHNAFICHVTSSNCTIKRTCDLVSSSPSPKVFTLLSLVLKGSVTVEMFFFVR